MQAHYAGQALVPVLLVAGGERSSRWPPWAPSPAARSGISILLLADRFTRHVSLMVMEHASRLDLASYEDPVFHDKLERARVQATDRIAMIQALGSVGQQIVAAVSLSLGILWFSPWLLVLLVAAVVPAFLGESHFAFLGYAQNIRQTPVTAEAGLSARPGRQQGIGEGTAAVRVERLPLRRISRVCPNEIYDQNVRLARRRLWAGAALSLLSTAGYYGAYAYVIYRTVTGALTWGTLQFLAGAIAGRQHQHPERLSPRFPALPTSRCSSRTWWSSCESGPRSAPSRDALPAPRPIRDGFAFEKVTFCLSAAASAASWTGWISGWSPESASP